MRVAVTGSHGLIAGRLIPELRQRGHEILRLVRDGSSGPGTVAWDPAAGTIDRAALSGTDAVIHLAGVGIGDKRWTASFKRSVLDSRVDGTTLLARTLAGLDPAPAVLLSGSAIGFYGDRDDELLTEDSASGAGFLAEVCRRWEAATSPATEAGIRTVLLRTGLVQAAHGGALERQLPLVKLGLGGPFGRGRQWWSWISIDDEVGAIVALLEDATVSGPVNLVGPEPVTNAGYIRILARLLHRPAVLAAPPVALKAVLGPERAGELLLASQRVRPAVLERMGFTWRHPRLEDALSCELRRA